MIGSAEVDGDFAWVISIGVFIVATSLMLYVLDRWERWKGRR